MGTSPCVALGSAVLQAGPRADRTDFSVLSIFSALSRFCAFSAFSPVFPFSRASVLCLAILALIIPGPDLLGAPAGPAVAPSVGPAVAPPAGPAAGQPAAHPADQPVAHPAGPPAAEITLAGHVIDSGSRMPLVDANIEIEGTTLGTVSRAGGYFTLTIPAAAQRTAPRFTLEVSYVGYKPARIVVDPVTLAAGSELEVALEPMIYQAAEVLVTASRYGQDVHLSHSNLTQQDIRRRESDVDIPLLLEDTPGLYASTDAGNGTGYTYLKIRGFDQRRIGVLINGIPLNDPEDHQVYWVDLPDLASSLEDVQIQRGVTNSVGGLGAIGGTVNLVTEVLPVQAEGRLVVQQGSYATIKQSLAYDTGLIEGRTSSALRLSHLSSDGYRDRSGTEQWAVFWSGRHVTPTTSTQVNIYTGREQTQQAWYGIDAATLARDRRANPEIYHNAIDDFRQPHYELHHQWRLSDVVTLRNSVYVIHGEGYYENALSDTAGHYSLDFFFPNQYSGGDMVDVTQQLWVRKDQVGWLPQLEYEHAGGRLIAGGDVYTFHSNHWGDVMSVGGVELPRPLKFQDFAGDKDAWSAFVNDRWEAVPGLTLLLDVQVQHRRYTMQQAEVGNFRGDNRHALAVDYDFFNPRGGLFVRWPGQVAGGSLGFYGHVGRTQLEPSLYDLYDTYLGPEVLGVAPLFRNSRPVPAADGQTVAYLQWSDPLVKAEKATNYELGSSFRTGALAVTLDGYWMDVRNEIVPFGGIYLGYPVKGNADKTVHRGVELELTWQPAGGHLLRLAASRSWDEFVRFVSLEDPAAPQDFGGNPIALFPEHLVSATWRADWGVLDTDVRWRAVGRQYLDNSGRRDRTIRAYGVVDLGLGLDLAELGGGHLAGARLQARIRNLLDEKYETSGYYDGWAGASFKIPAAERNLLVGAEYDF